MRLSDHPTVRAYNESRIGAPRPPAFLPSAQIKAIAIVRGRCYFFNLLRAALLPRQVLGHSPAFRNDGVGSRFLS